jgi:hypothetical protein
VRWRLPGAAAQTAVDMAALAPGGGIAAANGAELASCDGSTVEAVVTSTAGCSLVPAGLPVRVTARVRAVLVVPAGALARPAGTWLWGVGGQPIPTTT